MTITPALYTEINAKIIAVLDEYKDEMTQYDMLVIAVNLIVSYMEVIVKFDHYDRKKLFDEVVEMIEVSKPDKFVSRN